MKDKATSHFVSSSPRSGLKWSRRHFLQATALGVVAAPWVTSGAAARSPNSRLQHACIGTGGMGAGDLANVKSHGQTEIVALCDVDKNALNSAKQNLQDARTYNDWRELLEKEGDKIDCLNVTVPDHMHYPIAWTAIQKGKHVYVQKPMCHDVAEVRSLTKASVDRGVITQLGTQVASSIHERAAVQWLREGKIGKIKHLYLCSNRPGAVEAYRLKGPRPASGQPAPAHVDWNLWLGNAPERPFAPDIYHPVKWRAWQDFGTGWSGDIGCHIFDPVWKGLGMKPALTVVAEVQDSWKNSPERRADTWPQGDHITWTFPGNELTDGKELVLEWFDGEYYPPEKIRKLYSDDLKEYPPESAMVMGTEGALLIAHGYPPQLLPEQKYNDVQRPQLPPRNHYHHFLDAILGKEKNESHFAQTGPMTEAILLGTVAIRVPNEKLEWDHAGLKVKNNSKANALLRRKYRKGWEVPV